MATLFVDKVDPQSGTALEIGSSGDTITIPSGATIANSGTATGFGGITEIDYWRLSADTAGSGSSSYAVISSNWERVDTDDFNVKGTGLSESSGIFTFPSTGYYKIDFWFMNVASAGNYVRIQCQIDPQDGGGYSTAFDGMAGTTDAEYAQCGGSLIFDIPNVSHTMRFRNSTSSSNLRGSTSATESGFTCFRIGDT